MTPPRFIQPTLLGLAMLFSGAIATLGIAQEWPMAMPHGHHHLHHSPSHDHGGGSATTHAELVNTPTPTPQQPTTFTLAIRTHTDEAVTQFERFHEELMHLIIVSDDFQVFQHLHPRYLGDGQFQVTTTLPQGGGYTLIADYKPTDANETVAMIPIAAQGAAPPPPAPTAQTTQVIGTTTVELKLPQPLKAGSAVEVAFRLRDAATQQAVTDLRPYLGEAGHLVILRETTPLKPVDYVHAHAVDRQPKEKVRFMTQFPTPGRYKLWGQFQRGEQIVTAPFWVTVN
ncbi:MAG: hypothetical protein ACK4K5_04545 [Thermosynechococcus sp.]|uniref:hypothetical protein n=1 Tax=Thermosynechococcus sp. TaxID=2814275 RepID=UPI00391953BF